MSTATAATRTVAGVALPAPGRWEIDQAHTSVEFVARHLVVSKVRGRFGGFSGAIEVADDPAASSVEVVIEAASADTGDGKRDEHLRSGDFFDVERFPHLRFRSTAVRPVGNRWAVEGELTIRDVTQPVVLDTVFEGVVTNPWGRQVAVFEASTEVDRDAFGLTWNAALETGGVLVGNKVKIELAIQAVRASA